MARGVLCTCVPVVPKEVPQATAKVAEEKNVKMEDEVSSYFFSTAQQHSKYFVFSCEYKKSIVRNKIRSSFDARLLGFSPFADRGLTCVC